MIDLTHETSYLYLAEICERATLAQELAIPCSILNRYICNAGLIRSRVEMINR
jgi:hypothetical protein